MKPLLQALLIADYVYEDRATGKKVIAGVFHRITTRKSAPAEQPPPPPATDESPTGRATDVPRGNEPELPEPPPVELVVNVQQILRAGSPYAYISLTEVQGNAALRLQCVDLFDGQVMFGTTLGVRSKSPLDTVELVAPLPMLPAGRGDHLAVELLYEGELLGSARIAVDRQ